MEKQKLLLENNIYQMNTLIKNGRVIDPANNRDEICDIFVQDGKIQKI